MREIQAGLRYLFQTNNEHTFAITGTGTCAMEMVINNLLEPGQTLLTLVAGYWGERVADIGERLGLEVHRLTINEVSRPAISLEQMEQALKTFRPKLLYICHGDSSLGSVQCLDGLGELCRRYDTLLMVDAVVSLATTPLSMDEQLIDVIIAGAQKGISGPPGVGLVSFGDRAVNTYCNRKRPPSSFYMDLGWVAKAYGLNNNGAYAYHYTPAINLLFGLHEAIKLVAKEGLENVVARHQKMKRYLVEEIHKLDLNLLLENPEDLLAGITAVIVPEDIDGSLFIKYLSEKFDILIGGSLLRASGHECPKYWRIGYLGMNAYKDKIDRLIAALKQALSTMRSLKSNL